MADEQELEKEIEEATAAAESEGLPPLVDVSEDEPALTLARAVDITLGFGVVTVEAIDQVARRLWEDAPGILRDLETKGKPVRQQFADLLRGKVPTVSDVFTASAETSPTGSASDEIDALEQRARELEQQVATPPADAPDPSPFTMLEIDDVPGEPDGEGSEPAKNRKKRGVPEPPAPESGSDS
jgi:hypothetical protein